MEAQKNRETKEMELLFAVSNALGETLDLKSVLKNVLMMIADYMDMHRVTLTILNRKTGDIHIDEAFGLTEDERARGRYRIGEGITGRCIDTGEPIIIPSIGEDSNFLNRTRSRKNLDAGQISFICVPIKIGTEVIGALSVDRTYYREQLSYEHDVRLLTIIGSSISQAVRMRQLAKEELEKMQEENARLHDELKAVHRPDTIVGNSKSMRNLYEMIMRVADTNSTVLILGESGVGKEKIAHAVHYGSNRAGKPFIKFNCAALSESLIESELFGHERGAFTGAVGTRKGRFEVADCGTIFLDEIGEISLSTQSKLLRVLQEKEFERVGGNETIKVNVRVIAATNRNLEEKMRDGTFREDLYYRLNVFPLHVPPLRERKTDIMLLADYFAEKYAREHGKKIERISTPAIDLLMGYHWPGNVRELENCIERSVILSTDGVIHSYHLPPSLQMSHEESVPEKQSLVEMVDGIEREIIVEELKRTKGNMAKAARELGVSERVMGLRVEKHGIDTERFK